jgi:diguanylate cyclase (GGDEF)-like protein/PAS domain S-box-containing protein
MLVHGVSVAWLPAGLALAVVLLGGYGMLPGVALGAALAGVAAGLPIVSVLGIAVASTVAALLGAALLRATGFRRSLQRLRDVAALAALGGFVAGAVATTIAVAGLLIGGALAGSEVWLTWRAWWLSEMGGTLLLAPALLVVAAMCSERDVTETALARLGEGERALAEAQQLASIGSFKCDIRGDETSWSDELYRIVGLRPGECGAGYGAWRERIHPEDREQVDEAVLRGYEQREPWSFVHRVIRPDGQIRTVEAHGRVELDGYGEPIRMVGTCQDVTAFKLAEERSRSLLDALAHQARHDSLTGLPNRALLLDRLEHALDLARRSHSALAVLFFDIDDFKLVNDTLGHEAGDLLLVEMTPRLRAALRPGDTVARFGGDEFVVLCEDLCSEGDATRIARRIASACARPVQLGPHRHYVTISVGVAVVHGGTSTATELLRDADAAMYRAKALGKGRVEVFDAAMRERLLERIAVEADLRGALDRREFLLHYQPVMSLDEGGIVGLEALLRWQHPRRGRLGPGDFMEVAESTGLIVPIGEWAIEEACRQACDWREVRGAGLPPLRVSANLSARQLARSDIARAVARILERTGLDAGLLDLEITERVLLEDAEASARALGELQAVGVRLVLDDFGTGPSSLRYLKRFPIDAVKLDRSLVDGLGADAGHAAIVDAVLSMARALDVAVTAEGVETPEQLASLRGIGCPFAQGYLFSEPIPPADVPDLVDAALAGMVAG